MAASFVQSQSSTGLTCTLAAGTAAGDFVVLTVTGFWNPFTVNSVSGLGATWTKIQAADDGGNSHAEQWLGTGCTASQTVITITVSTNNSVGIVAQVGRGLTSPAVIASANSAHANSGTTGPVTPTASGQFVAGSFCPQSSTVPSMTDSPSAWTDDTAETATSTCIRPGHLITASTSAAQRVCSNLTGQTVAAVIGEAPAPTPSARRQPPVIAQQVAIDRASRW